MSEVQRYPVPADLAATAQINAERYEALYAESIADPEGFFDRQARSQLTWMSDQWDRVSEVNMGRGEVKWFAGGTLNACVNCIDRHLPERASQTAILWKGTTPKTAEPSPTRRPTRPSAGSLTPSKPAASKRATGSASTCP